MPPRALERERRPAVVEHEPVVVAERAAGAGGAQDGSARRARPRAARARRRRRAGRPRGAPRARARSRRRARRCSARRSQRIASRASTPRPSTTACASRSCTSSACVTRSSSSFARCAKAAFVSAMNGVSYGTASTGKPTPVGLLDDGGRDRRRAEPSPIPSPASRCSARRATYVRCVGARRRRSRDRS